MKWPPHADDTKTPWVGEELGCSQAEGDAQILQDMTKAASLTLTPRQLCSEQPTTPCPSPTGEVRENNPGWPDGRAGCLQK